MVSIQQYFAYFDDDGFEEENILQTENLGLKSR